MTSGKARSGRLGPWAWGGVFVLSVVAFSGAMTTRSSPAQPGGRCSVAHLFNPSRDVRTVVWRWAEGGEWTRLCIRASETATLTHPVGDGGEFEVVVEPDPAESAHDAFFVEAIDAPADFDPLFGAQYVVQRDPCTAHWRVIPRGGGAGVAHRRVGAN